MKRNLIVALMFAAVLALAACSSTGGSADELTGVVWQWTSMEETVPASQSVVPNPENYTITFQDGGSAAILADCNVVDAAYTLSGSSLTIKLGASTLAYCGDASSDVIYLASLEKVATYSIEGNELNLIFADDAGQMHFKNGGVAE